MIASDIITTPFAYYKTFVIEEQFGFNKTTKKLFILDKIKGLVMMAIIGGGIIGIDRLVLPSYRNINFGYMLGEL